MQFGFRTLIAVLVCLPLANAQQRASDEGQEGLRAFLEKRPPDWSA